MKYETHAPNKISLLPRFHEYPFLCNILDRETFSLKIGKLKYNGVVIRKALLKKTRKLFK